MRPPGARGRGVTLGLARITHLRALIQSDRRRRHPLYGKRRIRVDRPGPPRNGAPFKTEQCPPIRGRSVARSVDDTSF